MERVKDSRIFRVFEDSPQVADAFRQTVWSALFHLPFVQWDRFVDEQRYLTVYGWIDRENDAYKDFLILRFEIVPDRERAFGCRLQCWSATSSDKYSSRISRLLTGCDSEMHVPCERVEHFFSLQNMVRLDDEAESHEDGVRCG